MKKATFLATVFLIACTGLSACGQAPEPAPAATEVAAAAVEPAPTAPAVVADPVAPVASSVLWADPLPTCEPNQVATIQWSKEAVAGGPGRIVMGEGPTPALFALVGSEGTKETGEWAAPGKLFVLVGDDGTERARLVLSGPPDCP